MTMHAALGSSSRRVWTWWFEEAMDLLLKCFMLFSVVLVALAFRSGLFADIGNNPTLAFMLAGSAVIHFSTRPSARCFAATACLAVLFRLLYGVVAEVETAYFGAAVIRWGSFGGLASLTVLAVGWLRAREPAREAARITFLTAAALPVVWVMIGFLLGIGTRMTPLTFDPVLYAYDGALGFQPSFVLGKVVGNSGLLWDLTSTVYYALPFAVSILLATERRDAKTMVHIIPKYVWMMVVGFCLYMVVPAAGPIYAFKVEFPGAPPGLHAISLQPMTLPGARRNAIPSLHMAAALILWWDARRWPLLGRAAAGLFLVGTAFATLALGEHYAIDLVVAVPFTLIFQAGWTHGVPVLAPGRLYPMLAGAVMTAGWLAFLRLGDPRSLPLVLAWALPTATLILSFLLERGLTLAGRADGTVKI